MKDILKEESKNKIITLKGDRSNIISESPQLSNEKKGTKGEKNWDIF